MGSWSRSAGASSAQSLVNGSQIISGQSPGTANTSTRIELDAQASAVDGAYDPTCIVIYEGTGAGQGRTIYEYDGANRLAYISRDWKTIPDSTSKYMVLFSCNGGLHVNEGVAQAGGGSTITLNALASSDNSIYLGQIIFIVAGKGTDQAKMCVGYNGTTKVATVDSPWIVEPDSTSIYVINPFPGFVHGRPSTNSAENVLMSHVIGNKNDLVPVPYVEAQASILAFLHTGYYHVHGASFIYPDKVIPVQLTSDAAAWGIAATPTEIIPASTITKNFDIHWTSIADISATLYGIIDIYGDDGEGWFKIGPLCDVIRTSNFSREGFAPAQVPQQPANRRIGAVFSDSTTSSRTVRIKLYGHVYDESLT